MALDDFAPAAELNGRAEESDLDEDLFDFPLTPSLEATPATGKKPEPRSIDDSAPAKAEAAELEPEPASAPVATATQEPAPETAPAPAGLDPESDEDIFDFPPVDPPATSAGIDETALEAGLDRAASAVNDLLEDDLDEAPAQAPPEPLVAPAPAPAPAAVENPPTPAPAPVAATPVAAEEVAIPAAALAPAEPPRVFAVPTGDPRIAWILTGVVAVFLLGLLGIAWRATSNLGSPSPTGGDATGEVAGGPESPSVKTAEQQLVILEELLRQQKLATQAALGAATFDGPPPMQRPHQVTLSVARASIDEGRFGEARRVLYGLLATGDQLPPEDRAQAEETASYLLAESYRLEANTYPGEER